MMVFKLSYRILEVQELVGIAPVYPQFHPWLLCLLLHYIWGTEKKKKKVLGLKPENRWLHELYAFPHGYLAPLF